MPKKALAAHRDGLGGVSSALPARVQPSILVWSLHWPYAGGAPFPRRSSPTHFLALPASHAEGVVEAIDRVQRMLVQHNPVLVHSLVESITAHLTLLVSIQLPHS